MDLKGTINREQRGWKIARDETCSVACLYNTSANRFCTSHLKEINRCEGRYTTEVTLYYSRCRWGISMFMGNRITVEETLRYSVINTRGTWSTSTVTDSSGARDWRLWATPKFSLFIGTSLNRLLRKYSCIPHKLSRGYFRCFLVPQSIAVRISFPGLNRKTRTLKETNEVIPKNII